MKQENSTIKSRLLAFLAYLNIGQSKFEKAVGLSNGYINSLRNSPSAEKLQMIIEAFPQLNRDWLLTGNGDMINKPSQEAIGNGAIAAGGNVSNINNSSALDKAIDEISAQRKLVEKSQEQIDRLITIIENMNNK